jgi:shikimate dehydrogenase
MTTVYQCAVVGQPIEHSLSPIIHARFARELGIKLDYQKKLSTDETFQQTVKEFFAKGGKGLNITLPFKEKAFELADFPSESASNSKAANTLWQDKDGKIIADNTDGVGLLSDLNRYIPLTEPRGFRLGAGGGGQRGYSLFTIFRHCFTPYCE